MNYQVSVTEEALADMEAIYHYIASVLGSPENALAQYNRIADEILSLDTMPERYPLFLSEPEHSMRLRKLTVDHYVVAYIVDPDKVTVTDVLYGASDIHQKLMQRH